MITPIDTEQAFDKNPILMNDKKKILSKIVTERNFPNLMKSIYQTNKNQKNTTHRKYNT